MTQKQKIITRMIRGDIGKWWYPQDFMKDGLGSLFVGYEASARLSELAREHPYMVDSRREGKYFVRRLNLSDMHNWIDRLPADLRETFKEELHV